MGGFQNRPPREICNFCRPELHEKKFLDSLRGGALVSFLQYGVDNDAPGDALQFHNGCADHERDVPGACHRQDRLGIHAARIRDHRSGRGDCDVSGGIGIEERITAEVDLKGTMRIAPEHLLKRDLVGNPRFVVAACPVGKGHGAAPFSQAAMAGICDGSEMKQVAVRIISS